MIKLYGMPHTRSFRALWALEEIGVAYQYQLVNLGRGEGTSAQFLALNPSGKLPVLTDGTLVLTESAAICTYLADCHPHKNLIPNVGTHERARYNQWCCFVLSELEQPLWTMAKHKFALPKEYRVPAVQKTAGFEFRRALSALEEGLQGRSFLVGDHFTMADLLAVHTLHWARAAGVEYVSERLGGYLDRVEQRKAWQQAGRIDAQKKAEMA